MPSWLALCAKWAERLRNGRGGCGAQAGSRPASRHTRRTPPHSRRSRQTPRPNSGLRRAVRAEIMFWKMNLEEQNLSDHAIRGLGNQWRKFWKKEEISVEKNDSEKKNGKELQRFTDLSDIRGDDLNICTLLRKWKYVRKYLKWRAKKVITSKNFGKRGHYSKKIEEKSQVVWNVRPHGTFCTPGAPEQK